MMCLFHGMYLNYRADSHLKQSCLIRALCLAWKLRFIIWKDFIGAVAKRATRIWTCTPFTVLDSMLPIIIQRSVGLHLSNRDIILIQTGTLDKRVTWWWNFDWCLIDIHIYLWSNGMEYHRWYSCDEHVKERCKWYITYLLYSGSLTGASFN